ncbi:MAG: hypothetical protein ACFFCD_11900 [Promethearchaeota archaeon]
MDRDFNSSHNIEHEGLNQIPIGFSDVKPVGTESSTLALEYLDGIPYVTASSIVEQEASPL